MTPPPPVKVEDVVVCLRGPLICSPNRALTLGADGSSLYGALALSQSYSKDGRRCPVVMPVMLMSVRPPCVASLARPPPPSENISWYSGRLFTNWCPSVHPRRHPQQTCSRQVEHPVGSSLPPQTGQVCATVPGRWRWRARYTTATRCGGFIVDPLLQDVPQRLGDEQLLCCDNAGRLCNGGIGGIVGSG